MAASAHPRFPELLAWMKRARVSATPIDGQFFRVAGPRHTSAAAITSGIGAFKAGGRWNPVGVMKVVYLSEQPETAVFEANEHFRYHALPLVNGYPKVIVSVRVMADEILDLTQLAPAATLPESMNTLLHEDWRAIMSRGAEATPQAIGRAAFEAGFHGLIVPSKPDPKGRNLLVFPDVLSVAERIDVLDADALDTLGK